MKDTQQLHECLTNRRSAFPLASWGVMSVIDDEQRAQNPGGTPEPEPSTLMSYKFVSQECQGLPFCLIVPKTEIWIQAKKRGLGADDVAIV